MVKSCLIGTFGGAGAATCKKNDFRYIVGGGGTWYPPSKQSKCGCKVPTYVPKAGLPSFDYANMTVYLAGSDHPRLSFAFGETMEVHYQVRLGVNYICALPDWIHANIFSPSP
jgi:hypothetical protein